MEEEKPKKERSFGKIILQLIAICMISWGFYYGFESYKEKSKESEGNKAAYNAMFLKYQKESSYSDSLYRTNMRFNKYRHAAESQAFRDSVARRMEYKPGDIALRKSDSARVVVTDILVGGGLYDYYFRYRVMDKKGTEQEIKPELLFSKKKLN